MDLVEQLSLWDIFVRLLVAGIIGSALGIERRMHGKPAGLRTHALVALGSAVFALIGLHLERAGGAGEQSLSHVVQGVITGIGFLGAGAIMKENERGRGSVHGLTTAGSIWIVAGLGLACGAGYWRVGLVALALTLTVLLLGSRIENLVSEQVVLASRRSPFVKWLLEPPPPENPSE